MTGIYVHAHWAFLEHGCQVAAGVPALLFLITRYFELPFLLLALGLAAGVQWVFQICGDACLMNEVESVGDGTLSAALVAEFVRTVDHVLHRQLLQLAP